MIRFTHRRADGIVSIYLEDKDRLHFVAAMEPRECDLELARLLVRGANAQLAARALEAELARAREQEND